MGNAKIQVHPSVNGQKYRTFHLSSFCKYFEVRDIDNKVLQTQLWEKVKPHIPETFNGRSLLGPHPLMRVMRYQPEGFLSPHIDGNSPLD